MTVEKARALWKRALPFVAAAFALGAVGTAAARHYASDTCCKPGASCCYPGSPCCNHAADRISQR